MRSLKTLRISQKIMLLVAGLAVGFTAIGIAYFVQVSIETDVRSHRASVLLNERLLSEARIEVVQLESLLSQFFILRQKTLVEQQELAEQRLLDRVEQLKSVGEEFGIAADLRQIEALIIQYQELYQSAVNEVEIFGWNAEDGLRQRLTDAAQSLELEVNRINNVEANNAYLQMRHYERDFVAQHGSEFNELVGRQASALLGVAAQSAVPTGQETQLKISLDHYVGVLDELSWVLTQLAVQEVQLKEVVNELSARVFEAANKTELYSEHVTELTEQQSQVATAVVVGLTFAVVMGMAVGIFLIYKSIVFPLVYMQTVIRRINRGNFKARVKLTEEDELGDLGRAFNALLDERIQTLEEQSLENEQLNNSIIGLIRALGSIAQKNLTIKVPVSADITGTISDAVNLLTTETAKTLGQVRSISEQINDVSDTLQNQSNAVVRLAEDERRQVLATSKALELSARAMNEIATRAGTADKIASKTITDTQSAREAVVRTVDGILTIRETISETEKRIKRLGDRSQEISGIVNLINTIAERTHILALNASMHAASAGEAGKGFAVVADEVQRLAENAREATAEISSMVNSIRVETSDTVNIMNKLIGEVAQGTQLAEQADKKMAVTEGATRELVETVQVIAHSSVQQAEIANKIRDRAILIRNYSEKTGTQLVQQKRHTEQMKRFADVLLERVSVFELPDYVLVPLSASNVDSKDVQKVS